MQAEVEVLHELDCGAVDDAKDELRVEAEGEDEDDGRCEGEALGRGEIGESCPSLVERAGEDALEDPRMKRAVARRPRTESDVAQGTSGKEPLKMRNSPTKPLRPGRPSEEKRAMPMRPAEEGRDFAQASEVVEATQAAAALFEQGDEPEDGGGGEGVVEHLEEDAIDGGVFLREEGWRVAGEFEDGEEGEQAVAEVVDGGVGEDALEVALREGGVSGEDDGGDGEPEQRGEDELHLRAEDGEENAEEAVESHLGHGSGEEDGDAGGGFGVGVREPGVEGDEWEP